MAAWSGPVRRRSWCGRSCSRSRSRSACYLFIDSQIKASREAALKTVNAEAELKEKRGPSMLDAAAAVAVPFVANVGAGRFADAYQLLAAPYRNAVTPAAFEKACRASPLLAGARSVTLNRLRQQNAGGAATVEAMGVLDSRAGAVPIGFVFLQESGRLADPGGVAGGRAGPSGRDAALARRRRREHFSCNNPRACLAPAPFGRAVAPRVSDPRRVQPDLRAPAGSRAAAPGAPAAAAARRRERRRHGGAAAGARRSRHRRRSTPSCARWARRSRATWTAASRRWSCRRARTCAARASASSPAPTSASRAASDPRRPWSAWFSSLPVGSADNNGGGGNGGFLVIRRPLPARGERQIAHVYLPAVCNGAPEHFRFALPDAEPHATDPRALAYWANGFAHHVARQRLGRVRGGARPRALSRTHGEGGRRPVRSARRGTRARSRRRPPRRRRASRSANAASAKAMPGATARGAARVTAPRRDPSELARLMDTTTGMTSLQETLQTDRALLAAGGRTRDGGAVRAEAAVVQAAPLGGDDGGARPPGSARSRWRPRRPPRFYYVRFRSISHLIQLRERAGRGPRARARRDGRGRRLRSGGALRGRAGPAPGPADQAARPDGGRRPGGGGQRSLSARGQRPVVRVSGARAPRVRGGAGRHAGRVRRRARRAEVGRRSITRERRSPSRDRATAWCAATARPSAGSTSCRTAWPRPSA